MKQVFGLREPLGQMSPVHIPRGFTQAYIEGDVVEDLPARIRAAHAAFIDRDILLIEGTGHAGVGAVIGLSNATVASLLGAPGRHRLRGRRRPADRRDRAQRRAVRAPRGQGRRRDRQQGRPRRQARAGADARARPGAARDPAARRPAVPADPVEPDPRDGPRGRPRRDDPPGTRPRLGHRRDRHRRDGARAHAPADRAAQPGHRAGRPDRRHQRDPGRARRGGRRWRRAARARPDRRLPAGRVACSTRSARADLFATLVPEDTYKVASELHDLLVKTHQSDAGKIAEIKALLWEYLFIDRVLEVAEEARFD